MGVYNIHDDGNVKSVIETRHGRLTLTRPGFGERLAYARWLRLLRTGEYPADADIARATDLSSQWVGKWKVRKDAPDSRQIGRSLAAYLGVPEPWLMDSEGDAPEPELWARWEAENKRRVPTMPARPAGAAAKRKGRGKAS